MLFAVESDRHVASIRIFPIFSEVIPQAELHRARLSKSFKACELSDIAASQIIDWEAPRLTRLNTLKVCHAKLIVWRSVIRNEIHVDEMQIEVKGFVQLINGKRPVAASKFVAIEIVALYRILPCKASKMVISVSMPG